MRQVRSAAETTDEAAPRNQYRTRTLKSHDFMTASEVLSLVRSQIAEDLTAKAEQRIAFERMMLSAQVASVRAVGTPPLEDEELNVWLIGEEAPEGYTIIMQNDGEQFGLAATGFPATSVWF